MCAISGILNLDPRHPVDPEALARMTDTMSHRGPDGQGLFFDGNLGLGHRRLSIIDLDGGYQPMQNEDGSVVTVFNGEIYNYAELTERLSALGHRFRTRSDTETIVHAYEEYGEECVNHFRGMFAIAIWDKRKRRLVLMRDRLGVKPLYYYEGPGFLAFASEIKALLELDCVPREIDLDALSFYLSLRYVPGPRTMFRNIFKLQPGFLLSQDRNGAVLRKYWDLKDFDQTQDLSYDQAAGRFSDLLSESVRLRLKADVPLGVFLSGGLDSSSILAVMNSLRQSTGTSTFSVGYEDAGGGESSSNEFEFAKLAAEEFGSEHHECRITAKDVQDVLPRLTWHLDEPLADPTCVPLYFVAKAARGQITVVLSGEGADEILGGYSIYQKMLSLENVHRWIGRHLSGALPYLRGLLPSERQRAAFQFAALPLDQRYRGVARAFLPELKRKLIPWDSLKGSSEKLAGLFESCLRPNHDASALSRMLYADTRVWLPDDLLLKADKMTMANALELRVPFLDHRLVEFASRLPDSMKLSGGIGKVLLRQVMADKLPSAILKREKKGFPVPVEHWLRGSLRNWAHEVLLSRDSTAKYYMNAETIREVFLQHERGWINREREIWTLLSFELWHRTFLGRRTRSRESSQSLVPAVVS